MLPTAPKLAVAVMSVVNEDVTDNDVPLTSPDQCENRCPGSADAVNDIVSLRGAHPDTVD